MPFRRRLTVLVVGLWPALASLPAEAQVVRGRVLDDATGASVTAAVVELLVEGGKSVASTVTDSGGSFRITVNSAGSYTLRAERIGYLTVTAPPLVMLSQDTVVVELLMSTQAVVLAPLTVTAASRMPVRARRLDEFEDRRARGWGEFLGPDDIKRLVPFRASDLMQGMQGVRVQNFGQILMRTLRGGYCEPAFYIDGVLIQSMGLPLDDFVSASSIRAMEVYRRASLLPPSFSRPYSAECGAVVVWTTVTIGN